MWTADEVKRASDALAELHLAEQIVTRLNGQGVLGLYLYHGVTLGDYEKSEQLIGWPTSLADAMTTALHQWAQNRVNCARSAVKAANVSIPEPTKVST